MNALEQNSDPRVFLGDLDPNPLVVLGQDRRMLYANPAARTMGGPRAGQRIEGLKLGELLDCVHSQEPEGCGETPSCLHCGANRAIRQGLGGQPAVEECRITASANGAQNSFEFSVQSRPTEWNGRTAVFCALNDISHEKRRRVLEKAFFHDIMNTAGAVKGLAELLLDRSGEHDDSEQVEMLAMMRASCNVLLEEILSHRLMLAAETGQLAANMRQVPLNECLNEALLVASCSQAANSKRLTVAAGDDQASILTDPVLLGRVLTNLIKNALEATPEDGEVRLSACTRGEDVEFQVWNAGVIPEAVRLQVFTRSFTTKGAGRGIGTYSVKLFAEEYLHGRVTFTSNESDGTTFTVLLPWQPVVEVACGRAAE